MYPQRLLFVPLLALLVAASIVCDSDDDQSKASEGHSATPDDHVSNTGIPGVDAAVRAVREQDVDGLLAMTSYTEIQCISTPQGGGAPPLCSSAGVTDDSIIEALSVVISETEYVPKARVAEFYRMRFATSGITFYGVFRPDRHPLDFSPDASLPVPDAAVVFRTPAAPDSTLALHLRDGSIIAVQGFGTGAAKLPATDDPAWVVPPEP
jgi:hypothetical protein